MPTPTRHARLLLVLTAALSALSCSARPAARTAAPDLAREEERGEARPDDISVDTESSTGAAATSGGADEALQAPPDAVMAEPTARMPQAVMESTVTATQSTVGGSGSTHGSRPVIEPSLLQPLQYAMSPPTPQRVLLASVEVPPGRTFRPPASSCQDVLLYVLSGHLEATGTGIGGSDAPASLYQGDAVRFGPEGDALVINVGEARARTIVAIARTATEAPARESPDRDEDAERCVQPPLNPDPLQRPLRVSSVATTAPLVVMGGRLEVRILLDDESVGADHGGLSVLSGEPDLAIPEHRHEGAAEVLYIEDGSTWNCRS